jgi:hypothetical protein
MFAIIEIGYNLLSAANNKRMGNSFYMHLNLSQLFVWICPLPLLPQFSIARRGDSIPIGFSKILCTTTLTLHLKATNQLDQGLHQSNTYHHERIWEPPLTICSMSREAPSGDTIKTLVISPLNYFFSNGSNDNTI